MKQLTDNSSKATTRINKALTGSFHWGEATSN